MISSHQKSAVMNTFLYFEDDLEPFLNDSEQRVPTENRSNNNLVKRKKSASQNSNQIAQRAIHLTSEHESQQYEQDESEIWWHHQLQRYFEDKGQWWTFSKKSDFLRWMLTFITGFFCALMALFVTTMTKSMTFRKYNLFHQLLQVEKENRVTFGSAFALLFLCNISFGVVAWLSVYVAPFAAGSGIPEIKCFLNGLSIPSLISLKTLFSKAVGIIFACAAGLPLGKEGPMVHIGAIIAAGISQGKVLTCGIETTFSRFQDLRNDREVRDFVACGAAAGVAAAFGAPIGGVLFSLEEGASYWSTRLTWRCFFCAMTTVFFLFVFATARSLFGHSDTTAMFSFGEFFSLQGEESNYSVWELFLFILVGCFGGLAGAVFNQTVGTIFYIRQTYIRSPKRKLLEVIALVTLMTAISTILPLFWSKCTPLPVDMEGWSDQEKNLVESLVSLYCDAETEYNELASLYLADSDTAIRQLFHFREVGDHNDSTFSSAALFMFFVPYLFVACLTYGAAVPAGMFVPSLLSGAALGRLLGHLLHKLDNAHGTFADSGTYALIGAAAMTSGIARMTISLTVMILEATGDMQYVLPLMLTILSARLVGNFFTMGLYDQSIHQQKLPFLDEEDLPTLQQQDSTYEQHHNNNPTDNNRRHVIPPVHDLTVADIMAFPVFSLRPIMTVDEVLRLLSHGHHCYPVIDDEQDEGVLLGTILRKVVCTLLKNKAFAPSTTNTGSSSADASPHIQQHQQQQRRRLLAPLLNWGTIEHIYPEYPEVNEIESLLNSVESSYYLDFTPYMDPAPYVLNQRASLQRTYRMFRTLGLRHLIVVDGHYQVKGVVTRRDLTNREHEDIKLTHHTNTHDDNDINGIEMGPRSTSAIRRRGELYLNHTINLRASIHQGGSSGNLQSAAVAQDEKKLEDDSNVDLVHLPIT